jgi:hypothetical protein
MKKGSAKCVPKKKECGIAAKDKEMLETGAKGGMRCRQSVDRFPLLMQLCENYPKEQRRHIP